MKIVLQYSKLFFLFFLVLVACKKEDKKVTEEVLRPIRYAKIFKSGSDNDQLFSGSVQSSKQSKLSFKVAGTVNAIKVKVGDRIRKGQIIAAIDALDYRVSYDQAIAQLKSAETQIKSAETQLVTSRSNYERMEKLYENNSIPLSEYEQARGSFLTAQAQYDAAIAQVSASRKQSEAALNQVDYAILKAPYSGVVTEVHIEENEIVSSGTPIAVLNSETDPEVRVGIPEIFISDIKSGQQVEIMLSIHPDKVYSGSVNEVGFSAGSGATYRVIARFTEPDQNIRPGMAANVKFHFHLEDHDTQYLIAPVKAIGEGSNGNFVFILIPEGDGYKASKKLVEIGRLLSSGFEVLSGLNDGDLVATAGLKSLLDGMKVKLAED